MPLLIVPPLSILFHVNSHNTLKITCVTNVVKTVTLVMLKDVFYVIKISVQSMVLLLVFHALLKLLECTIVMLLLLLQLCVLMDMVLLEESVLNVQLPIVLIVLPLKFVPCVLTVSLILKTVVLVTNVNKVVLLVPLNVGVFPVSKKINLIQIVVVPLVKLGTLLMKNVTENLSQKLLMKSNLLLTHLQTS